MHERSLRWLTNRLVDLAGIFLLIMMLHISLDVILKYTINKPIKGTLEVVSYYYMVIAVFMPLAFVELTRSSIAVDLFYNMFSRSMRLASSVLVMVICIAVYAGLAYSTYGDAMRSLARNEIVMGELFIPIWPSRFILPVSFALATIVCVWHLLRLLFSAGARDEFLSPQDPAGGE